jgi:hypothetical protein
MTDRQSRLTHRIVRRAIVFILFRCGFPKSSPSLFRSSATSKVVCVLTPCSAIGLLPDSTTRVWYQGLGLPAASPSPQTRQPARNRPQHAWVGTQAWGFGLASRLKLLGWCPGLGLWVTCSEPWSQNSMTSQVSTSERLLASLVSVPPLPRLDFWSEDPRLLRFPTHTNN